MYHPESVHSISKMLTKTHTDTHTQTHTHTHARARVTFFFNYGYFYEQTGSSISDYILVFKT